MAITYPLTFPTGLSAATVNWRSISTTSISESMYTGTQTVTSYQRQRWSIDFSLPPMTRSVAEQWIAFLVKLNGREGTFTYGPTGILSEIQGSATYGGAINGASQTGNSLVTDGWATNTESLLKAGDFISFDDRLYKVLTDVDSDASGNATIDIWPSIRTATDNEPIIISSPTTTFRLTSDQIEYSIGIAMEYGLNFSVEEAL